LGGIAGRFGVARHRIGSPKSKVLVPADEFLVGRYIALLGSLHELDIIQWPAPHGSILI